MGKRLSDTLDNYVLQAKIFHGNLTSIVNFVTVTLRRANQVRNNTCDPVSTHCSGCPVKVFQNLMHLSAVPPPEDSRPC